VGIRAQQKSPYVAGKASFFGFGLKRQYDIMLKIQVQTAPGDSTGTHETTKCAEKTGVKGKKAKRVMASRGGGV
jgi:hypothetical protein